MQNVHLSMAFFSVQVDKQTTIPVRVIGPLMHCLQTQVEFLVYSLETHQTFTFRGFERVETQHSVLARLGLRAVGARINAFWKKKLS